MMYQKCNCSRLEWFWKLSLVSMALMLEVSDGFSSQSLCQGKFQKILSFQGNRQKKTTRHAFLEWEKKEAPLWNANKIKKPANTPAPEMGVNELISLFQPEKKDAPVVATEHHDEKELGRIFLSAFAAAILAVGATAYNAFHLSPEILLDLVHRFFQDPAASLEAVVNTVDSMGPMGMLFFGGIYIMAEILAIPGFPLVASAGYLFGVAEGTAIILASATIAACVSFWVGRTALRSYVEDFLKDQPDLRKIDRAIEKQGFKLMLLLRLSPIFPFALSNYVYGASSVSFWEYFWGTVIGFLPGTLGYVYAGAVGKALTLGGDNVQPWYVYAGAFLVLGGFLKMMADVATDIVNGIEEENDVV